MLLPNRIHLAQESREVAVHVAGYVAKRFLKSHACCKSHLTGTISESNLGHAYIIFTFTIEVALPMDI